MNYCLKLVDLQHLPPAESVLSQREQAFFHALKLPKRRTEWLGGRWALKQVLASQIQADYKDIEILSQDASKPHLEVQGKPLTIAFSITHSHGFAVAAVSWQHRYLGIDLEKIATRIVAWKEDFFHPSELTDSSDEFLTSLWTQKEAVVKLLGTGLSVNSFDVRCVEKKPQFFRRALEVYQQLGSPLITLETVPLVKGFCFSVAWAH